MLSDAKVRDAVEQYREEGYAIVRQFVDGDEMTRLRKETDAVYEEGLKHHATYRHGNLSFQILPESDFGKRYVLQAYWFSWVNSYFEQFRRNPDYLRLLEGLIGRDIRQIAQQLHWKPPGANLTGYRYHQDLRFRNQAAFDNVADATVTTGLAVDRATLENGCLQVVPGSHKLGYLGLSDEGTGELMKGLTAEDELRKVGIDPATIVPLELEPGDLAMWGLLTVHGSAPDIAGKNIANPIGQIWSGAMMLEHLGAPEAAAAIVTAIERVLASGENLTRDMGGDASTSALGQAIADAVSVHPMEARRHG